MNGPEPSTQPAWIFDLTVAKGSKPKVAFISVHAAWPLRAEAYALRERIAQALKLSFDDLLAVAARQPSSPAEARALAQELRTLTQEAGTAQAVCFGRWALACVFDDPGFVVHRSAASGGADLGAMVFDPSGLKSKGGEPIGFLLVSALEELQSDASLKKETWRQLQTISV